MNLTVRLVILLHFIVGVISANVQLPALFASNMVLQQKSDVKIWGWADVGEKITIVPDWNNKSVEVLANAEGKWIAELKTPVAGGPYTIHIIGNNKIILDNVLIGEVWLCSGQSNMHMPVGKFGKPKDWRTGVLNYEQEIDEAKYPQIRFFTADRKTSDTLQTNTVGQWDVCSPQTVAEFSAVAYFFGRELNRTLNIPIGLISSNFGGTPAEAWTRKEILENDSNFQPILDRYKTSLENYPALYKEYTDTLVKWQKALKDSLLTLRQSQNPPRPPLGRGNNKVPCGLYNAMIAPLIPFTIKGVIWYQGESNADRAWQYRTLFPAMIANWRTDWNQGDFPFYFVQIAPHRGQSPEIRESQLYSYRSVPNTGIVVTTDIGDSANIHPINKQTVGYRLSLWALANDYGVKNLVYSGPLYKNYKVEGEKIRIQFDYVGSGLNSNMEALRGFKICGEDKKFVPASAKIEDNTVVVWAEGVKNPLSVRFGWENVPELNLFNKEGLPASPFRTDDWPEKTFGKN